MNKEILGQIFRALIGAGLMYLIYYILSYNGPMLGNIIGAIAVLVLGSTYIFDCILLVVLTPIFFLMRHK